ncbi:hypothetical protein D3C86_1377980 [compost metagenome]
MYRLIDPGVCQLGRWPYNRQAVLNTFDRRIVFVGQPGQVPERIIHLALRQFAVGAGIVVSRLGIQQVGDIGRAAGKSSLRPLLLTLQRCFLSLGRSHPVQCSQGFKIGLRHVEDQPLFFCQQLEVIFGQRGLRRVQMEPAISAKQWLNQVGLDYRIMARLIGRSPPLRDGSGAYRGVQGG